MRILLYSLMALSLCAKNPKIFHTLKVEFAKNDIVMISDKQLMQCNICKRRPMYIHVENGMVSAYCSDHVTLQIKQIIDRK